VRAYVTNTAGTAYGSDLSFTTTALAVPVATSASGISATGFTANWNTVDGAATYNLDVSAYPAFSIGGGTSTLTEGFSGGTVAPAGWTFTAIGGTYTSTGNFGAASPSLKLDATGDAVETSTLTTAATQLKFWYKGQSTNTLSVLKVEGYNGTSWVTIESITPLMTSGTTITFNSLSIPALPANIVKFRFTYTKSSGNLGLDDITIISGGSVPSFIAGWENHSINAGSQPVTSLAASTPYYYRVRATSGSVTTTNSNVITVTTTAENSAVLAVTPATLAGLTYVYSKGPSTAQIYTLSGSFLANPPGIVTVTGSSNYEVSDDNIIFSGSVTIPYTSSTLENTPIYVNLKAGLNEGLYANEVISNVGGGAVAVDVIGNGSVTALNTGIKPVESALAAAYSFNKTVYVNMKDNSKGDIYVYNAEGKLIRSIPALQGLNRIDLDATGIYIVKVLTLNVNMVKKVWVK